MLTRWYTLLMLVAQSWLWFGGGKQFGRDLQIFLSGLLLWGLLPCLWVRTLQVMGRRSLRGIPVLSKAFFKSKRGALLTGILVFFLLFLWSPVAPREQPLRVPMTVTVVLAVTALWLQPPYALFLGESSRQSGESLSTVSAEMLPLRIVALLASKDIGYVVGGFSPFTDNLRTESGFDWKPLVEELLDVVESIVLDTRTDHDAIVWEVGRILAYPDRIRRTVVIVNDDDSAPALEFYPLDQARQLTVRVHSQELGLVLKSGKR